MIPQLNHVLEAMVKGLALHYLHRGTVQEALAQGKAGGVPEELLECLPGMIFEVTSAAGAVFSGNGTFDEVVDELTRRALASGNAEDFSRDDAAALVTLTLDFLRELCGEGGGDAPLPPMAEPWYRYGMKVPPTRRSIERVLPPPRLPLRMRRRERPAPALIGASGRRLGARRPRSD